MNENRWILTEKELPEEDRLVEFMFDSGHSKYGWQLCRGYLTTWSDEYYFSTIEGCTFDFEDPYCWRYCESLDKPEIL